MNNPSEAVRDACATLKNCGYEQTAAEVQEAFTALAAEVEGLRAKYTELHSMYLQQGLNYKKDMGKLAACEADARRYRWLHGQLLAVDFAYDMGDKPETVLVFKWPDTVRVGADLTANVDAAMQEKPHE